MNRKTFELIESDFIDIQNCPLCGYIHRHVLRTQKNISIYKEIYPQYSLIVPESFTNRELLRCQFCGHVYWGKIPNLESLPSYKDEIIEYNFNESRKLKEKANLINDLLIETGNNGVIVDIGTCRGELLFEIRKINSEATLLGIEPSLHLNDNINNIKIIKSLFNSGIPIDKKSVSVFSAFDCFEHMPKLNEAFESVNLFIKNNGYLYIETPNGDYYFNNLIGRNNINLFWIEHLSFLTRDSIQYICDKYGYDIVSIENSTYIKNNHIQRIRSMISSLFKYKVIGFDSPVYINCKDHLKIIIRKK